jgi:hypothetical protein
MLAWRWVIAEWQLQSVHGVVSNGLGQIKDGDYLF